MGAEQDIGPFADVLPKIHRYVANYRDNRRSFTVCFRRSFSEPLWASAVTRRIFAEPSPMDVIFHRTARLYIFNQIHRHRSQAIAKLLSSQNVADIEISMWLGHLIYQEPLSKFCLCLSSFCHMLRLRFFCWQLLSSSLRPSAEQWAMYGVLCWNTNTKVLFCFGTYTITNISSSELFTEYK